MTSINSTNAPQPPSLLPGSLACLAGKTIYLDISNGDPGRPLVKFIRKHLRKQGAIVDDFLSRSVHYVFTDRNCCSDDGTNSLDLCNAVPSIRNYSGENPVIKGALSMGIGVYRLATIETWLRRNLRMMGCLSSSAGGAASGGGADFVMAAMSGTNTTSSIHSRPAPPPLIGGGNNKPTSQKTAGRFSSNVKLARTKPEKPPLRLNGAFIRLDDQSGEFRPFYHEMTSWPVLRLDPLSRGASSTAAAGGSPFVDLVSPVQPSIQPGPRLVVVEKKPTAMRGYCEACCMVVADIDRHLQGDEHAKRIKKAATNNKHPVVNKSANKSGSKLSKTIIGADADFAKPLATLDAVISQHFGPTPLMRTALLESYLEQAAGDFLEQENCINQMMVLDEDDDEGDEGSVSGEAGPDEEPELKRVRNESQQVETIKRQDSPVPTNQTLDPKALVSKLEVLAQEQPVEKAVVVTTTATSNPIVVESPDILADDNWGDQLQPPKLSSSSVGVAKELDSLTIVEQLQQENQSFSRKTRRLLPTIGATAQALAQLQSSSSSLFVNDPSSTSRLLEQEGEPSSSSSSSLPFALSPRKQIKEAEMTEKIPKRGKKTTEGEKKPRKPRKKKVVEPEVPHPPQPPSPIIPSRSAPQMFPLVIPCSTQVGFFVNQPPQPNQGQFATFQFPAAFAQFLQQQQPHQSTAFAFGNPQIPTFSFVPAQQPHPQQQPPYAMMTTRRRSNNNNNNNSN